MATGNDERGHPPPLWYRASRDEWSWLETQRASERERLFYDYRTNVDAYPKSQAWMREKQPRLLVIWGKYDLSLDLWEPEAYRRDVPNAQVHVARRRSFPIGHGCR